VIMPRKVPKAWVIIDRAVVACISLAQVLWSGEFLFILTVGNGPAYMVHMLWGTISACFMFTGWRWTRIVGCVWQITLLAVSWSAHSVHELWWLFVAIIYLGITASLQFHIREVESNA